MSTLLSLIRVAPCVRSVSTGWRTAGPALSRGFLRSPLAAGVQLPCLARPIAQGTSGLIRIMATGVNVTLNRTPPPTVAEPKVCIRTCQACSWACGQGGPSDATHVRCAHASEVCVATHGLGSVGQLCVPNGLGAFRWACVCVCGGTAVWACAGTPQHCRQRRMAPHLPPIRSLSPRCDGWSSQDILPRSNQRNHVHAVQGGAVSGGGRV